MSEPILFEYLCRLRDEILKCASNINGEANARQLYYRTQYLEKLGMYHNTLQLMQSDVDVQIKRVSEHIKMIKEALDQ
jgi:hypothetical protein